MTRSIPAAAVGLLLAAVALTGCGTTPSSEPSVPSSPTPSGGASPADAMSAERFPRTLDVLRRTCRIAVREDLPRPVMRVAARRMIATLDLPDAPPASAAEPSPTTARSLQG